MAFRRVPELSMPALCAAFRLDSENGDEKPTGGTPDPANPSDRVGTVGWLCLQYDVLWYVYVVCVVYCVLCGLRFTFCVFCAVLCGPPAANIAVQLSYLQKPSRKRCPDRGFFCLRPPVRPPARLPVRPSVCPSVVQNESSSTLVTPK